MDACLGRLVKGFSKLARPVLHHICVASKQELKTPCAQIPLGTVRSSDTAVADAQVRNASLSAVDVRLSELSAARRIFEVVFSFTNRATEVVDKFLHAGQCDREVSISGYPVVPVFRQVGPSLSEKRGASPCTFRNSRQTLRSM